MEESVQCETQSHPQNVWECLEIVRGVRGKEVDDPKLVSEQ